MPISIVDGGGVYEAPEDFFGVELSFPPGALLAVWTDVDGSRRFRWAFSESRSLDLDGTFQCVPEA